MGHDDRHSIELTVVIPAVNEAEGIGAVIASLDQALARESAIRYEILVVDDGSTDGTADVVGRSAARLVQHAANRGYGASLKTGIRNARYDLICITDADGTYPSDVVPRMVHTLIEQDCDMVVASRTGKHVRIPWVRRPAKWVIGRLADLVAETHIPDINSGLRVFRRATVRQFFNLLPSGFSFTTTLTLAMMSNDCRVDYIAIDYFPRVGRSKIRPVRDTLGFTQLILRIALYFAPLKIFLPLSALLLVAAIAWGLFSAIVLRRFADASTLVVAMAAVQVAVVGLLAELVNRRLPNYYRED